MTSEGIPVSDRQEAPSNSGEGSPQVKSMRMPGGEIVPMTLYLDGTSSMPIHDPATGVTQSEHYTREQTSQLMEVVREVKADEDPSATHTPEQQPSQEARSAQPLSGVIELPEGGNAQIVRRNEEGGFIVHILNPDGSDEEKLVARQDLKEFGLPDPDVKVAETPKQEQTPPPKTEKVAVGGDEQAKPGEAVPVRKLQDKRERPVGPQAEHLDRQIDALTAKIKENGAAISEAQREGRNEDAQALIEKQKSLRAERDGFRKEEQALLESQRGSNTPKFDPDAEAERIMADVNAKGDALERAVKDNLDAKYPPIKPEDAPADAETAVAATDEDIAASLAEAEAAKARLAQSGEKTGVDAAAAEPQPAPAPKVETGPAKKEGLQKTPRQLWLERVRRFGRVSGGGTAEERSAARAEMNRAFDELLVAEREAAESIRTEFDELTVQYAQLGDDASPEARRDIEAKLLDAQLRLRTAELSSAAPTTPEAKRDGSGMPLNEAMENARREQQRAERQAQEETLVTSLEGRYGRRRKEYMDRYAQLKADDETRGGRGQRKRAEALKAAEAALFELELQYAKDLVEGRRQNGNYEGVSDEVAFQMQSDDLFNQIRTLDARARGATVDERLDRVENRNILQKGAVQMGRFFNWGNNGFLRHGKNAAAGFLATGVPLAFGMAWPVTLIAGAVGVAGRYGAVLDNEDNMLRAQSGEDGTVTPTMTDQQFTAFMDAMRRSDASTDDKAARLSQEIFDMSREKGRADASDARRRASRNMTSYAIGGVIGGFTGNWIHNALTPPQVDAHMNEGTLPSDRYPAIPKPKHIDLHGARRPWNYAADQVGPRKAMAELRERAADAISRGHTVKWYRTMGGGTAIRIDGSDVTQKVIDVLWGNK